MKNVLVLLFLFFTLGNVFSQNLKIKKNIIYVNDTAIFKTQRESLGTDMYVYDLNGNELIYFQINDNGTSAYSSDDYLKIFFNSLNRTLLTTSLYSYPYSNILGKMLKSKVFNTKGEFDEKQVDLFIEKYKDDILTK